MRKYLVIALLLVTLVCLFPGVTQADGLIIPVPPPSVESVPNLAIKYHHVTVTIEDQVAVTHVDQVFVNTSPYEIEGTYVFPLPEGASISQFAMWVDGQRLEAQVLDAEQARSVYEEIVRQRRDPALLEYVGHNAFLARIYPIAPHAEKRVEIEYSQVLSADGSLVRYVYPLNTEKFSSLPLEDVSVSVQIASQQGLEAIYSPSHTTVVERQGEESATVRYAESNVTPNRDFVLYYGLGQANLGASLITYKEAGEDGFFLLLLTPKSGIDVQSALPKDVFFVLDTSGSMRGEKLEQAKRAATYVLDNLNPDDRFNIISFGTSTLLYADSPQPAGRATEAHSFIQRLSAHGGTNIERALQETLAQTTAQRPQIVLFLTDGLATEGVTDSDTILAEVANLAGSNVRLFTFGVGYDVNTVLLDTMAQAQRGTSAYVQPEEDIEVAVSSLYEKISLPVLANIALDFGAIDVQDTYPYPLPDLFAGSQLVLVGRYRSGGSTDITLRGVADGQTQSQVFRGLRFETEGGADFIPRLWATRKIGYLLTQIRLHGADPELVSEIIDLSVRYGIITPYTSFLVDETEDALTVAGRQELAAQELRAAAAPTGEGGGGSQLAGGAVSGAEAVNKSQAQEALRSADVAAESQDEQVRSVGSKTFVLRAGVWSDTTYDPDATALEKVAFGSERYFELLRAYPAWGPYLALGTDVLIVWEGQAYQIGAEGESAAHGLPPANPATVATPEPTTNLTSPTATPTATAAPTNLLDWLRQWLARLTR